MTLDGLFACRQVAATYIILFSIYGAVLEHWRGPVLHRLVDGRAGR
jgi:hypothetical protein